MPQLPDGNSIVWVWIRQIVLCVIMFAFLIFAYQNKIAPQDIAMYLTIAASLFGVDITKRRVESSNDQKPQ